MTGSSDSKLKPPLPEQAQEVPGYTDQMDPRPDHGEESYRGSGRLGGMAAIITGGDSGIGRAVAIAYAREGADVLIAYLSEHEDAKDTANWVEKAGRKTVLMPGDVGKEAFCREVVERAMEEFGRIDVVVNNAAHQQTIKDISELTEAEIDLTFRTNIYSHFFLCKAALPHMREGGSIINTASINSDDPSPDLLCYATTKGAVANFTAGLAQLLGKKGIRVNAVAPGPIWTPLIPSTMAHRVKDFGKNTPLGRPGQPAELAGAYVLLASREGSYMSGAIVPVTGGRPIL